MTLEETTELYASVLRQLLPVGGYDTSPNTEVLSKDIYAHAKLFAHADLDAKRLLNVLEGFPSELISEYEAEYGLPLKCSINAGRTLAERTEILRWIRQHRNVMNREYLEQILAIFGVTLVDVVKHYPMQCTAPCTAAVNTERLRYKVLLRLQYPMAADMSCIIENYLPGYLRVEWVVDMPWGEWIVNPEVTFNTANSTAHYKAFKTNQRDYYDSYADFDLVTALVRSFHDADMQQWQAVKDAANELTGVTNWVVDTKNNFVTYTNSIDLNKYLQYVYNNVQYSERYREFVFNVNDAQEKHSKWNLAVYKYNSPSVCNLKSTSSKISCTVTIAHPSYGKLSADYQRIVNPNYDPAYIPEQLNISFISLAQKIISNTQSSNQSISLLAEAYVEAVAKSIFNPNESKQFVKLSDLLSQFEINKTLRT